MGFIRRLTLFAAVLILLGAGIARGANTPSEEDLRKSYEHQTQGNIYDDQGNIEAAIKEYKEALRYDPADPNTLFNLGVAYLKTNKPAEAAKAFEQVVNINEKDYEALNLLGLAYRGSGQIDKAKEAWKKSLEIDPSQTMPQKFLEELKKDVEEAKDE